VYDVDEDAPSFVFLEIICLVKLIVVIVFLLLAKFTDSSWFGLDD